MRIRSYPITVAVSSFVVLACLFGVRGALSRQAEKPRVESVTTEGGLLTITHTGPNGPNAIGQVYTVRLGGKTIHTFKEMAYVNIYSFNSRYEMGDTVLLSVANGGNGCPAMFYIVHIKSPKEYYITEEFGDCSDVPSVNAGRQQMEIKFPGFYQLWQESEPGFKPPPPTTYVYRDKGKVTELRPTKKK